MLTIWTRSLMGLDMKNCSIFLSVLIVTFLIDFTESRSSRCVQCQSKCAPLLLRVECPRCDCIFDPCQLKQCTPGTSCKAIPIKTRGYVWDFIPRCVPLEPVRRCEQRRQPGRCPQKLIRYYFNPITNRCQFFIYGGCGGNGNNFRSYKQCKKTCLSQKNRIKKI